MCVSPSANGCGAAGPPVWEHGDRGWMHFTIRCPQFVDRDEELYEELCYVTFSSVPPELLEQPSRNDEYSSLSREVGRAPRVSPLVLGNQSWSGNPEQQLVSCGLGCAQDWLVPLLVTCDDDVSCCIRDEEVEYCTYYARINEVYEDLCSIVSRAEPEVNISSTGVVPPHAPRLKRWETEDVIPFSKMLHRCVSQDSSVNNHSLEKRDYVIKELVETEKNYVDVLATVQRSFMRPLSSFIREEDMKAIFSGMKVCCVALQELSEIHSGFHSHLRKAVAPNSSTRLSDVFINWREKFLIYGEYCAHLTSAQELIQDLCSRNEVVNQQVIVSVSGQWQGSPPAGQCVVSVSGQWQGSPPAGQCVVSVSGQWQDSQPAGQCVVSGKTVDQQVSVSGQWQGSRPAGQCVVSGKTVDQQVSEWSGTAKHSHRNGPPSNVCAVLQKCQEEANGGKFKLRDILSVPMQRILKYHLLLDKLIQETQPVSPPPQTPQSQSYRVFLLGSRVQGASLELQGAPVRVESPRS
uniref:DH domain-containing protein n=1 Tax=Timema douglasi TaxID=61478 RepID=A0A7R8ZAI0_TIMDO|nr:unnamed protein product [Timema douglasi]